MRVSAPRSWEIRYLVNDLKATAQEDRNHQQCQSANQIRNVAHGPTPSCALSVAFNSDGEEFAYLSRYPQLPQRSSSTVTATPHDGHL